MHSPLALRSKAGTAVRNWIKSKFWLIAVVIVGVAVAAYFERRTLHDWFAGPQAAPTILVSGNIEAHQSVLGFKTVQSRIVELPFNEGQWVNAGTLIARLDDSDYRQQVAISEATLDVQKRQLAAAEQNCAAAQKPVESDAADLELAKLEFTAPTTLMKKGCGHRRSARSDPRRLEESNAAIERDRGTGSRPRSGRSSLPRPISRMQTEALKLRQNRARLYGVAAPFDGVITGAPGGTRRDHGAGHPGGDTRRSRSHLAARLYQRDRYRQDSASIRPRRSRPTPIRGKATRAASPSFPPLPSSRRKASKPTPSGSRWSTASRSISTIRPTSWFLACRPMRCWKRFPQASHDAHSTRSFRSTG